MRLQTLKLGIVFAASLASASAQWLNYPEPGTPLTANGKPDLSAKTPRAPDGKPDLSGVWGVEPSAPGEIERLYGSAVANGPQAVAGDDIRQMNKYFLNLFIDFKRGEEPIRPEALAKEAQLRKAGGDNPYSTAHCLPYGMPTRYFNVRPLKIYQTPKELVIFYEVDGAFRQIHTDGRKLPVDPFPAWMGYSTGHWDGDTMIVDSSGYNDKTRLPGGHIHSEHVHFQERFHRRDFGHMDMEITVEDPEVLTKPVTVKFMENLIPNSDILEYFCSEGERDSANIAAQTR
jgi:hypothetical protein